MSYHSSIKNKILNPYWITGDGESCFHIGISKNNKYITGWFIWPVFKFTLHKKDELLLLLEKIKTYFRVGRLYNQENNTKSYMVTSITEIEIIINHLSGGR